MVEEERNEEDGRVPDQARSFMVYLAGPISGLSYDEAVERRRAAARRLAELGHVTVSPMRGKEHLRRVRKLRPEGYRHPASTAHAIVERDSWDVKRCDVLLADLTGARIVSIGTVAEIAWGWLLHKYVIVVMEQENVHRHAFIEQCASLVCETTDEAVEAIAVLAAAGAD